MFQSILRNDYKSLKDLEPAFKKHDNQVAALLCLDHVFSQDMDIRSFTVDEMAGFLHTYARLLHRISMFRDPVEHSGIRRLFSIVQLSGDEFLIPRGTFLHSNVTEIRQGITLVSEHSLGYRASRRNVTELLQLSVRTVLKDKVSAVNDMCYESPVFSQCLTFIVSGGCRRENCPQEHVPISKLDRMRYNTRVAIHIWQILILQLLYSAHPHLDRRDRYDWRQLVIEYLY
jgi:hypothetical protein